MGGWVKFCCGVGGRWARSFAFREEVFSKVAGLLEVMGDGIGVDSFLFLNLVCFLGFDLRFSEVWFVFLFLKRRNRGIRCTMLTMCFFRVHIADSRVSILKFCITQPPSDPRD